jgi:hypothetical protein
MTVAGSSSAAWFPEPSLADDTYASRGELVTDWLKRSTVQRARDARRFLTENLAKVTQDHQLVLYRALHERWHSAFPELIVASTLQLLGGDIEAEPQSEAGTRIDFRVRLDISGSGFHADGVFNKGEGDPTWAAVLAFVNVYLGGGVDPVLYLHPRFQGDLPETLTSIERRSFDPVAGRVNMVPTRRPGFIKGPNFVPV